MSAPLLAALLLAAAAAGHPPEAAVLEVMQLRAEGGPDGRVAGATEALRAGVDRSGRFHPLTPGELGARLTRPGAEARRARWPACAAGDESTLARGAPSALDAHLACAAAQGSALGVDAVMLAAIARAKDETVIAVRRIDVAKARLDAAVQERAPFPLTDDELRSQLIALGRRLAIAPARLEPLEPGRAADEEAFSMSIDGPRAMELVSALAGAGVKPIDQLRRGRRYALPSLSCEPAGDAGRGEPVCSLPVHGRAAVALFTAIRGAGADRGGARLTDVDCDVMSEQAHCTFVPH